MVACVRVASAELPQSEIVFFRNFIALLILIPIAIRQKISLRTEHLGLHFFRAFLGLCAMYLYFYAVTRLPLADAVLLNYTSPLFIALFAVLWLKEEFTLHRKLSGFLGLVGVFCLFHPSSESASLAGLAGLLSGLMAGLAQTTIKKLSNTESSLLVVLMFAFFASIISAVPMVLEFTLPSAKAWLWLIAVGGFGTLGQLSLTRAYKLAPASQVSPLGYCGLLFAGLIGFFFWNESPGEWALAGSSLIVIAGVIVAREKIEPLPHSHRTKT